MRGLLKSMFWLVIVAAVAIAAYMMFWHHDSSVTSTPPAIPSTGLIQQGSVTENETALRGISSGDRSGGVVPQIVMPHAVCGNDSQSAAFTLLGNGSGDVIVTIRKASSQSSEIYSQYVWTLTGDTTSQWDFVVPTEFGVHVEIDATGGGGTADAAFVDACN